MRRATSPRLRRRAHRFSRATLGARPEPFVQLIPMARLRSARPILLPPTTAPRPEGAA